MIYYICVYCQLIKSTWMCKAIWRLSFSLNRGNFLSLIFLSLSFIVIMFSWLRCEIFVQFESSDRSNGVNFHLDFYLRRSPWTQLHKGKQYTFFNERHKNKVKILFTDVHRTGQRYILNIGKLLAMKLCWYVCVWTSRAEQSHPSDGSST